MATEGRKEGRFAWNPEDSTKEINTRKKYCNWFITSWREDDNVKLCADEFPPWVRRVVGGMERAEPTLEQPDPKPHFQGLLNTHSVQFSQVKSWLPGAHFEVPRNLEAAKRYCLKARTAIGPKSEKDNPVAVEYLEMHELAILVAGTLLPDLESLHTQHLEMRLRKDMSRYLFEIAMVRTLKRHGNHLFSSLSIVSFQNAWCVTYLHWLEEARKGLPTLEAEPGP